MQNIELMRHAKPELPTEQVNMLVKRAQRGDKAAEAKLVQHNLGLVAKAVNDYRNDVVPAEDRAQAGTIGLIAAIRAFDPERGLKFSTYATPKIRQAVRRLIHDTAHMIHIPVVKQDGREAVVSEYVEAAQVASKMGSLNALVGDSEGETELVELLGEVDHGFEGVEQADWQNRLRSAIAELDSREADVLTSRYLLGQTLQEIANRMPGRFEGTTLTRQRVAQIEADALGKLKGVTLTA